MQTAILSNLALSTRSAFVVPANDYHILNLQSNTRLDQDVELKSRQVDRDSEMPSRKSSKNLDDWIRIPDRKRLKEMLPEALQAEPIKVTDGLYFYRYKNLLVLPTVVEFKEGEGHDVKELVNFCSVAALAATTQTPFLVAMVEVMRYADKVGDFYNDDGFQSNFVDHVYAKVGFQKYKVVDESLSVEQALKEFPNAIFEVKTTFDQENQVHCFASFNGQEVCDIGWAIAGGVKEGKPKFLSVFIRNPEQLIDLRRLLRS